MKMKISLTETEYDILELISQGKTRDEITSLRYISIKSVDTHLSNIYDACGFDKNHRNMAVLTATFLNNKKNFVVRRRSKYLHHKKNVLILIRQRMSAIAVAERLNIPIQMVYILSRDFDKSDCRFFPYLKKK